MAAPGMLTADTSQFDLARKRATQQNAAEVQAQKDALARRQAQLGGGVSGALIKQEQLAHESGARRLADVNEGIDAAVAKERGRVAEINSGREYQTAEREAGQNFASGQADLQRRFQTGEREASQTWQGNQADLMRKFQTSEREAGQTFASGEAAAQRKWQTQQGDLERALRIKAMDIQQTQFGRQIELSQAQFAHEKEVDAFNMDLARRIQGFNEKPGMLDSFFGNFSTGRLWGKDANWF